MLTLLHVSDVHFGEPYVPAVGESLVRAAHDLDPDIIVLSGDFTQRARESEYREAADWIARLPDVPKIKVPGNHDVPLYRIFERIFSPYQHYRAHIHDELDYVVQHERAIFVALNTTSPLRAIVNGRIRSRQLDLCEEAFSSADPALSRIVVAHHHFAPAPDYEGGQVMPNAREAIDRFSRMKVDMIMGGHLHRAYIGNSLDVYPGADRDHGIIIVQSGTSTSRRGRAREREKNSFNLVRVGDEVIRVTHYMFFDDPGGFAPASRHIFPRPGRAYLSERHGGEFEPMALAPIIGLPASPPPDGI
jgi:3',5'-cyclic AMP phosphodiesterase CpdA